MSKKFHINPTTGDFGECKSTQGQCPFGGASGEENHFTDKAEAYNASMAVLASKYGSFNTLKQADRFGATVFDKSVSAGEKRGVLKEYYETNTDDVYFAYEEAGLEDDSTDPIRQIDDASDADIDAAIAKIAKAKEEDPSYTVAHVFAELEETRRQKEMASYLNEYNRSRPVPQSVIDDAYDDEPAKKFSLERELGNA